MILLYSEPLSCLNEPHFMETACKIYIQENAKLDFDILKKWTSNIPTLQDEFYREMHKVLVDKIRNMILNDMDGLLRILYRMDVYEQKIKLALRDHEEKDAALLIADLYLQRILEKYESKKNSSSGEKAEWIFDI